MDLGTRRLVLPFVGVLLRCLDEAQRPLGVSASGFIRREGDQLYLYTCWHVVTGFDPHDVRIGRELPQRRFLEIAFQDATPVDGLDGQLVGGLQSWVLPLYDSVVRPAHPLWLQDDAHIPHLDLNAVGLFVPFFHDAVKIALPGQVRVSNLQVVNDARVFPGSEPPLAPGDKCLVVGYPYGFSAFGADQPTPVVLTRFVASDRIAGRRQQFLLEGIAAPGMSGGPVYVERGENLYLVGLYTGAIYPDHAIRDRARERDREKVTDLGTVSDLRMMLWGHTAFVKQPSQAQLVRKAPSND